MSIQSVEVLAFSPASGTGTDPGCCAKAKYPAANDLSGVCLEEVVWCFAMLLPLSLGQVPPLLGDSSCRWWHSSWPMSSLNFTTCHVLSLLWLCRYVSSVSTSGSKWLFLSSQLPFAQHPWQQRSVPRTGPLFPVIPVTRDHDTHCALPYLCISAFLHCGNTIIFRL